MIEISSKERKYIRADLEGPLKSVPPGSYYAYEAVNWSRWLNNKNLKGVHPLDFRFIDNELEEMNLPVSKNNS